MELTLLATSLYCGMISFMAEYKFKETVVPSLIYWVVTISLILFALAYIRYDHEFGVKQNVKDWAAIWAVILCILQTVMYRIGLRCSLELDN